MNNYTLNSIYSFGSSPKLEEKKTSLLDAVLSKRDELGYSTADLTNRKLEVLDGDTIRIKASPEDLAKNPNETHVDFRLNPNKLGESYDAYESELHSNTITPRTEAKLAKQRQAIEDDEWFKGWFNPATNEDVFARGQTAKQKLQDSINAQGSLKIKNQGKDQDNRILADILDSRTNESMIDSLNTSELNASYNTKYNEGFRKQVDSTPLESLQDAATSFGIGATVLSGQALVGTADLAQGLLKKSLGIEDTPSITDYLQEVGYDPLKTKQVLDETFHTDKFLTKQKKLQEAMSSSDDEWENAKNTAKFLLDNPEHLITGTVMESLPMMLQGGLLAKASKNPLLVGAITEGTQSAAQIADTADIQGRTQEQYVIPAIAAGIGTGAINLGMNSLAGDALISAITKGQAGKTTLTKALFGEATEEALQTAQEQVFTNIAEGEEDIFKGIGSNTVLGAAAGAATGGPIQAVHSTANTLSNALKPKEIQTPAQEDTVQSEQSSNDLGGISNTVLEEDDNVADYTSAIKPKSFGIQDETFTQYGIVDEDTKQNVRNEFAEMDSLLKDSKQVENIQQTIYDDSSKEELLNKLNTVNFGNLSPEAEKNLSIISDKFRNDYNNSTELTDPFIKNELNIDSSNLDPEATEIARKVAKGELDSNFDLPALTQAISKNIEPEAKPDNISLMEHLLTNVVKNEPSKLNDTSFQSKLISGLNTLQSIKQGTIPKVDENTTPEEFKFILENNLGSLNWTKEQRTEIDNGIKILEEQIKKEPNNEELKKILNNYKRYEGFISALENTKDINTVSSEVLNGSTTEGGQRKPSANQWLQLITLKSNDKNTANKLLGQLTNWSKYHSKKSTLLSQISSVLESRVDELPETLIEESRDTNTELGKLFTKLEEVQKDGGAFSTKVNAKQYQLIGDAEDGKHLYNAFDKLTRQVNFEANYLKNTIKLAKSIINPELVSESSTIDSKPQNQESSIDASTEETNQSKPEYEDTQPITLQGIINEFDPENADKEFPESKQNDLNEFNETDNSDKQTNIFDDLKIKVTPLSKAIDTKNINIILETIIAKENSFESKIAKLLINRIPKNLFIEISNETISKTTGKSNPAKYYPTKNTIVINRQFMTKDVIAKAFLHELVHALTIEALNKNPEIRSELNKIIETILSNKNLDKDGWLLSKTGKKLFQTTYLKRKDGTLLAEELLAYGFTEPLFQLGLESIPYENSLSLWDKFVNVISKALGITHSIDKTALASVLDLSLQLMNQEINSEKEFNKEGRIQSLKNKIGTLQRNNLLEKLHLKKAHINLTGVLTQQEQNILNNYENKKEELHSWLKALKQLDSIQKYESYIQSLVDNEIFTQEEFDSYYPKQKEDTKTEEPKEDSWNLFTSKGEEFDLVNSKDKTNIPKEILDIQIIAEKFPAEEIQNDLELISNTIQINDKESLMNILKIQNPSPLLKFIKAISNLFQIKPLIDNLQTKEELNALIQIEKFQIEFKEAFIKKVNLNRQFFDKLGYVLQEQIPVLDEKGNQVYDAKGNPQHKNTGLPNENVIAAMGFAALAYLNQNTKSVFNTTEMIQSIFGKDENFFISDEVNNLFADVGKNFNHEVPSIGKAASRLLGFKAKDSHKTSLVEAAMGNMAINTLIEMGFLQLHFIPKNIMNSVDKELPITEEIPPKNEEALKAYIKEGTYFISPTKNPDLDYPVIHDEIKEYLLALKISKRVLEPLLNMDFEAENFSIEPFTMQSVIKRLGNKWKNSFTDYTDAERKAILNYSNIKYTNQTRLAKVNLEEDVLKEIGLGYSLDTIILDVNEKIHKGKLIQVNRNIEEVNKVSEALKTNKGLYFFNELVKSGREMMLGGGQSNKYLRWFLVPEGSKRTLKFDDKDQTHFLFKVAILTAFGEKVHKKLNKINELFDVYLNSMDEIYNIYTLSNEFKVLNTEQQKIIRDKVFDLGEGYHSLAGLVELMAYKKSLEDKSKTFSTSLLREDDGITNGPFIGYLLYGDFDNSEDNQKSLNSFAVSTTNHNFTYSNFADNSGLDSYELIRDELLKQLGNINPSIQNLLGDINRNFTKNPVTKNIFGSSIVNIAKIIGYQATNNIYNFIQDKINKITPDSSENEVNKIISEIQEKLFHLDRVLNSNYSNQSLTVDELKNFKISLNHKEQLKNIIQNTIQSPLEKAISKYWFSVMDNRQVFNRVYAIGNEIAKKLLQQKVENVIQERFNSQKNEHGKYTLFTKEDLNKILEELKDILPNMEIPNFDETNHKVYFWDLDKSPKYGKKAYQVQVEFNTGKDIQIHYMDENGRAKTKDVSTDIRTHLTTISGYILESIGVKVPIGSIHNADSIPVKKIMNSMYKSLLVHDGVHGAITDVDELSYEMNKAIYNHIKAFNPYTSLLKYIEEINKYLSDPIMDIDVTQNLRQNLTVINEDGEREEISASQLINNSSIWAKEKAKQKENNISQIKALGNYGGNFTFKPKVAEYVQEHLNDSIKDIIEEVSKKSNKEFIKRITTILENKYLKPRTTTVDMDLGWLNSYLKTNPYTKEQLNKLLEDIEQKIIIELEKYSHILPVIKEAVESENKTATESNQESSTTSSAPNTNTSAEVNNSSEIYNYQSMGELTNHSGGAIGADTHWDTVGKEYGMLNNKHYWMNNKTPNGNTEISKEDAIEGQKKVTIAARQMGRIGTTHQIRDERLIRNWSQVKYSDAVFAITTMLSVGNEMNYGKKALIRQGKGGTGYAIQMAINEGKPVYVFDQIRNQWFKHSNGKWEKSDTPILTKNFAGIGTRELNADGKQAIRDVYQKTIEYINKESKTSTQTNELKTNPTNQEIKDINNKPDVILPIGTSGSGKSTFIKSLPQDNLEIIEPDAMRVEFTGDMNDKSKDKEIYIEAAKRAIAAIKKGKLVVFDTTNLTKEKRLPFIEAIKKEIPNANIQYKLLPLNPELAKQRIKAQLARGENRANVSDATIDRHAESYIQMLEDIKNEPITPYIEGNLGSTTKPNTTQQDKFNGELDGLYGELEYTPEEEYDEAINEFLEENPQFDPLEVREAVNDKFKIGSTPGVSSTNPFIGDNSILTSENVEASLEKLFTEDRNIVDSEKHQNYLRDTIKDLIAKVMKPIEYYQTKDGDTTYGFIDPTFSRVAVNIAQTVNQNYSGIKMSAATTYVHELIHAVTGIALTSPEHFNLYRETVRLFNHVKSNLTSEQIERYAYVFKNDQTVRQTYTNTKGIQQEHIYNQGILEFIAYAKSEPELMKLIEVIPDMKDIRLQDMPLNQAISSIFNRIIDWFNRTILNKDLSTRGRIDAITLALSTAHIKRKPSLLGKLVIPDTWNKYAIDKAKDLIAKPLLDLNQKINNKSSNRNIKNTTNTIANLVNADWKNINASFREGARKLGVIDNNIASSITSEIAGSTEDMKKFHKQIAVRQVLRDHFVNKAIETVSKILSDAFTKKLTKGESETITKVGIKGDISYLSKIYSDEDLIKLLSDETFRQEEISNLQDKLIANPYRQYFINQVRNLGSFMINNTFLKEEHINAHNVDLIINNVSLIDEHYKPEENLRNTLKQLSRLYAIEFMQQSDKESFVKLLNEEKEGIATTLKGHDNYKKNYLNKILKGNKLLVVDGAIKESYNPNRSLVITNNKEGKGLVKQGYYKNPIKLKRSGIDNSDSDMYLWFADVKMLQTYQQAGTAFTELNDSLSNFMEGYTASDSTKQIMSKLSKNAVPRNALKDAIRLSNSRTNRNSPEEQNSLTPKYNQDGRIIGFTYTLHESIKDEYLDRVMKHDYVMASMNASIIDQLATKPINERMVDTLIQDQKEFVRYPKLFVQIGPDSPNKEYRDIWFRLPKQTKEMVKEKTGFDYLMVREEALDYVFGYRKVSATNWIKPYTVEELANHKHIKQLGNWIFDHLNPNNKFMNMHNLRKVESGIQEAVKMAKDTIVIKLPKTLIANELSNTVTLHTRGIPADFIIKEKAEALTNAKLYFKTTKEILELEYLMEIDSKYNTKDNQNRLNQLHTLQTQNPVHQLVQEGVFQTIVEDIAANEGLWNWKSRYEDKLEKLGEKVPKIVKETGKFIAMTHDTKMYKFLHDTTQVSDLTARYVLHKWNLQQGMKLEESLDDIVSTFVNYELPTHRFIEYGNEMGVFMFTKYFFRILKPMVKETLRHPLNVAALHMLQMFYMFESVHNIEFTDVFNKINDPFSTIFSIIDANPFYQATT